jgi:hypothetical protein
MQTIRAVLTRVRHHLARRGEVGEGVISAAIAVLIMAFLGALMWVGFRAIWEDAEQQTSDQIQQIGG